MRYARVELTPDSGSFHPLGRALRAEDAVTREAVHRIDRLDDGT
jgi:hypothetical protein